VKSLSVQIQMITGSEDDAAPICTIVRSMTAKANRPAPDACQLEPIPARKTGDCDADDALGYRTDGRTAIAGMFLCSGTMSIEKALPAVTSCEP